MAQFQRIVVLATPGQLDPSTLREAASLAETNAGTLTVLDVIPPMMRRPRSPNRAEGRPVDVKAALLDNREEGLRNMVTNTSPRWASEVKVVVGEPVVEVIRHVQAHGNDLVVIGSRGAAPSTRGDVTQLLRECPVPVWVARPTQSSNRRVLALVDPDPHDPVKDGLNDLVLEHAAPLGRRRHAELHVGHAWRLDGESALRSSPYIRLPAETVDRMVDAAESSHRDQLDSLMERHRLSELDTSVHLVPGEPHEVLPVLAEQLDIGLIVMGTVARTGLRGLIVGNTAETILRAVRCSMLAVKPHGFVSPVQDHIGSS